jgi:hypothetical protein
MKPLLFFFAGVLLSLMASAQQATISGTVKDDTGQPVPFASILIRNTSKGTSANSDGAYSIQLAKGSNELLFKAIGYKQILKTVQVTGNQTLNIVLVPEAYQLQNVLIKAGGEDPAYAIIRKAIRKRKTYLSEVRSYTCEAYIKGLQKLLAAPKKFLGRDIDQIGRAIGLDSNRRGIIYLSESESRLSFMQPDKVHEEMISSKVSGSNRAFSFNRASDMNVNFYEGLQEWGGLNDRPLISPIADNALSYYNYKYMGLTTENGETINKIKVTPKRLYEPTFSGYIYIMDDSWRIHSVDLYLTKSAGINFVDTLTIKQQFIPVEQKAWMPSSVKFEFTGGIFGFKFGGYFVALYKNYEINPPLDKKLFTEEMRITREVNKKDTAYWQQVRPIPLTDEEKTDYKKKEVLAKKRESKPYLDSLDHVFNRVTPSKFLFTGMTFRNRYQKETIRLSSVFNSLLYNTVEGLAVNYGVSYTKQIDSLNNKYLFLNGHIRYGFSNKLLHANITGNIPLKGLNIGFSAGSDVQDLNNTNPISFFSNTTSSLLYRRNYKKLYDKRFASVSLSHRIAGGWQASVSAEAAERNWLDNTSYYSFLFKDRKYTANNPFTPDNENVPLFDRNQSFKISARTSYNFSNHYVTYPTGRYYLPSKYPHVEMIYTKGIKNIFGSDVDYDLLSANITQSDITLGLYGKFSFYIAGGKFLNKKSLYFTDYKHFLGNEQVLYQRSLNAFLLLDYYTYSTADKYFEAHLDHNFSGLFLSKIPLVQKFKLQEIVQYNYLTTPTLKNYSEFAVGVQYLSFRALYGWSVNTAENIKSAVRIDLNF